MVKEIKLTQGKVALIDDEDFERVLQHTWHYSNERSGGVAKTRIKTKGISMHRFVMNAPKDRLVDHINGNRLDNRKCNLRLCALKENCKNRQVNKNNTSGYKGVSKQSHYNNWIARIMIDNKGIHLGVFPTAIEAAMAYDKASIKYFGEFGRTNQKLGLLNNQQNHKE